MSHTRTAPQPPDSQSAHRDASPSATTDLRKLDDRIRNLSQRILPKQPYLVTIPSEYPYRRHTNDPNLWYKDTPFSRDEEQLQYMSLLPHQEEGEDLLRVEGSRIDDDGRFFAYEPSPRSDHTSRPPTPLIADTPREKKKISLKDYKTKDKSALNTPDPRQADDIRRLAIKGHKEDVAAKIDQHVNKPDHVPMKPVSTFKPVAGKMPVKAEVKPAAVASVTKQDAESQRSVKKRKLSDPDLARLVKKDTHPAVKKEQHQDTKPLPALLSPTIPAAEKKQKPRDLPDLLSPLLPPSLENVVSTPSRGTPQTHRTEDVKTILRTGIASPLPTERKTADTPKKDDASGRIRSDSQLSAKSALGIPKISSPATKPLPGTPSKPTTPLANGRTASPKLRQKHTIVLKYGKKNRKRVESLLRFAPRPKKAIAQPEDKTVVPPSKPTFQTEPLKLEQKRPTDEPSEAPPIKKQKIVSSTLNVPKPERPTTPKTLTASKSPAMDSKPKSTFSTPKKEFRPAAMQRVASTDTADGKTPRQEITRTSTPVLSSQLSQPGPSPGPTSTPARSEDRVVWTDLGDKVYKIGRSLKKQGTELANENDSKKKVLGMVLMIESLLCFMINSAAQSYLRPNTIDAGWASMILYLNMIRGIVKATPYANGLVTQLSAVIRNHIHQENLRRLAKEPLPDEQSTSAPTPGSDGTTRTDDPEKNKQRYLEFKHNLVHNSRDLQQAWIDGAKLLSLATLEDNFKETWKKRKRDTSKRSLDRPNPKDLSKDFYLPLDSTTTAFEAANFTVAFLSEWTRKEGVEWKTKLDL